jgi:hypothetical protein
MKRGTRDPAHPWIISQNRSAMELSFGMIFSIILIISFLAFAIYAILTFIKTSDTAKIASFRKDFQEDIDKMWRATQGSQKVSYSLPGKINEVCIVRNYGVNLLFYPLNSIGDIGPLNLSHINLTTAVKAGRQGYKVRNIDGENRYMVCFNNTRDKVSMVIKKNFGENLVNISAS